jgi:NAD-dependent SIR2 family protein deacetylase
LDNYESFEDNDPTATWNLVVEQMLYDIPEELSIKTFNFYLDQKVTTWMKTEFEVKANDLNEAVKIAKEMYDRGDLEDIGWQEIDGLNEVLQPSENGNEPTAEIYYMDKVGEMIQVLNNTNSTNPNEVDSW